jgi:glycosyltransferase involved in cell wall biosynthesis
MKLLIVADGRSPITLNWIRYLITKGHSVSMVSSYPCTLRDFNIDLKIIPVAFSQAGMENFQSGFQVSGDNLSLLRKTSIRKLTNPRIRTIFRQWLGLLTIPKAARHLKAYINQIQPDLVHAMRIPYEGMLAASANPDFPLLISVWGNDFTLHAKSNPWMGYHTRKAIHRADAIHTDCWRDLRLAREWGFSTEKPSVVLPSSGGVRLDIFYPPRFDPQEVNAKRSEKNLAKVINPRGFRAYVRNDIFFKAIPLVLEVIPEAQFICPGMQGEHQANRWLHELNISKYVNLLPLQTQEQMGELFRSAQVTVSPTIHDGTPNSLLESMACGCFPVAGDLESIREWITSEVNGLLINPNNFKDVADAIIRSLTQTELRVRATEINSRLISERAEYSEVMEKAANFYNEIIMN